MKVTISTLVIVASKVCPKLDAGQFHNAVRAYYARNRDSETVTSTAKLDKEGEDSYSGGHTVKVKKVKGADARAIHWLACVSELVTLDLSEVPVPSSEVKAWLDKFVPATAPAPAEPKK